MELLKDRIEIAMKAADISAADIARACKVKPPSVADWLSGKTKELEAKNLLNLALAARCNPYWLAMGLGQRELSDGEITALWRQLDETRKKALVVMARDQLAAQTLQNATPSESDPFSHLPLPKRQKLRRAPS